ncbi:hypothetical protein [Streptomyces sp. R41]|uniref:Uncharacterized protein n=1 Tax=Streptomyces sp. R41 TaxID=3238632 RepID=A0AB39REA1_9ACTN
MEQVDPAVGEIDEKLLPFVEAVSPESERWHHCTKPGHYAVRGIPVHLIS